MIPLTPPAIVEVDQNRKYIAVNDAACALLGYSREELLQMSIEQISYPSGAHVTTMFENYQDAGGMKGIFAVKTKAGEILWIRYEAAVNDGRMVARWYEYEPATL